MCGLYKGADYQPVFTVIALGESGAGLGQGQVDTPQI